jgi:hypothetical protein
MQLTSLPAMMEMEIRCPITQEAIVNPIVLRGASFELSAVLDLLRVKGPEALHPYERTLFTDTELLNIYLHALHLEPSYLLEQGWMLPGQFMAGVKATDSSFPSSSSSSSSSSAAAHRTNDTPRLNPTICSLTFYEASTCLILVCLLLLIFLIMWSAM